MCLHNEHFKIVAGSRRRLDVEYDLAKASSRRDSYAYI